MKKNYIAPTLEVVTIETTNQMLTGSNVTISSTQTTTQWGRGSDDDWDDDWEDDWED